MISILDMKNVLYFLLMVFSSAVVAEDKLPYPCNYYIETVDIAFNAREQDIGADVLTEWYAEKNIPTNHLNDHFTIISIIYDLKDDDLNLDTYLDIMYGTAYWCGLKWGKLWEKELSA
jgi:hypothetical protein